MSSGTPLLAITGATGFVGTKVVKHALSAGYHVRALIRNPSKKPKIDHPNLTWHQGALGSDDEAFLKDADGLIHIAGLIKAKKRSDYFAVNADAAGNLTKAAQSAGVKRFILLSSQAASQPQLSHYAASKHAGEVAVKSSFNRSLAIIRAPAIFGPGDEATKPFFNFIKKGRLPCPGGKNWKDRKLSFTYVDDLARDIVETAVSGAYDGKTVYPATLPQTDWAEFADICAQVTGQSVKPFPIPLALLYTVAGLTSVTSHLFGMGHLTLGKLNEFLYEDWSSQDQISGATDLKAALKETMDYYERN